MPYTPAALYPQISSIFSSAFFFHVTERNYDAGFSSPCILQGVPNLIHLPNFRNRLRGSEVVDETDSEFYPVHDRERGRVFRALAEKVLSGWVGS
jgi:hypothetical protein